MNDKNQNFFDQQEFNSKLCYLSCNTLKLHEEMLQDEVKILSFKCAIENNKEIFKDKVNLN
jgi:hypothetical protein